MAVTTEREARSRLCVPWTTIPDLLPWNVVWSQRDDEKR